ncbi:hypothetical protein Lepto7375DRAFT_7648 [Leptolyngbya sp. PCC 7375]|nr:hypothetical protein Lepto7375DRAFT_7648 [Leptolyngbya sp. PCC 7375]
MAGFNDLLNKIRQKPGMYIGSPAVSGLHLFLCGYGFARQEQGLAITVEEEVFEQFQPWVQERFGVRASVSWAKIVLLHAVDERGGFELFYELWDEFMAQQQAIDGQQKSVA